MSMKEKLVSIFGETDYSLENGIHILTVRSQKLINDMKLLKDQQQFNLLLDICGVDNSERETQSGKRFEVVYHLLNMSSHERLRVRVPIESDKELVPSIVSLWKGANWFEREVWDMFGIKFEGQSEERLLTHSEFVGHPLRKDFDSSIKQTLSSVTLKDLHSTESVIVGRPRLKNWVNVSTKHPGNYGLLNTMVEVQAERVTNAKVDIGYLHRGIEKLSESRSYSQISLFTDRLNYSSAPMNTIGWCKTVEELLKIEIPDRAKAMRMVIAEFSRVMDHLLCIAYLAKEVGALSAYQICVEERERIGQLFEEFGGSRQGFNLIKIGGLANKLSSGWIRLAMETLTSTEKCLLMIDQFLTRTQGWIRRTKVSSISANDAISWGYTGPCLRASGVNYDIRKVTPYYFYEDVDFEVPLGVNGECYDRYLVRLEEVRQSLGIIGQVLDHLPTGLILSDDPRISNIEKSQVHTDKDALKRHHEHYKNSFVTEKTELYSCSEAANGELGFYLISNGDQSPYRLKVRAPSFSIFQSFPEVVIGNELMDATVTLSSLNIIAGELDR